MVNLLNCTYMLLCATGGCFAQDNFLLFTVQPNIWQIIRMYKWQIYVQPNIWKIYEMKPFAGADFAFEWIWSMGRKGDTKSMNLLFCFQSALKCIPNSIPWIGISFRRNFIAGPRKILRSWHLAEMMIFAPTKAVITYKAGPLRSMKVLAYVTGQKKQCLRTRSVLCA